MADFNTRTAAHLVLQPLDEIKKNQAEETEIWNKNPLG